MREWSHVYRSQRAAGGQRTCWALNFPPRCSIDRLRVTQVGGAKVDFSVSVYSRALACGNDSSSSGGDDPGGDYEASADSYLVLGPLASDAPGKLSLDLTVAQPFMNMDGTGPSSREYRVYVQMSPEGSEDCTFDVAVTARVPHGGD